MDFLEFWKNGNLKNGQIEKNIFCNKIENGKHGILKKWKIENFGKKWQLRNRK